jgi:hypothetical protein
LSFLLASSFSPGPWSVTVPSFSSTTLFSPHSVLSLNDFILASTMTPEWQISNLDLEFLPLFQFLDPSFWGY